MNVESSEVVLLICGGTIGFIFSISKNILWSGLSKIFPSGKDIQVSPITDPLHNSQPSECKDCLCLDRIKKSEACMQNLKKESVSLGKDMEYIKLRMDKSDAQMEKMGLHIQSIDRSLQKIVTIVEERTRIHV